ncbi:hypothetical protein O181_025339 [Austropuccinia psidii MF-1]|uniref:Uncharacterized protein n=1 Tax=Austropuccinia psidii MF-1 TaxID=1389203 RepID=A0A9Q3CHV2_9BASI|nr:hypothetical protein [Austropuccinia psidii MF-1]
MGTGKRHSDGLITAKTWTPIATQKNRKPRNSASIQGKPTLTTCTGKITIINPVVTSKGKLPKSEDNKFVQGTVKENLASKGTNQRTEMACPEPEDLKEDTSDAVVDGKKLREIIPTLPFTLQLYRNLKPAEWKDMGQVLQLHQLFKDLFQWSMDNKRFNLASHWAELGASCHRICLKAIDFRDLMEKTRIQGKKQDHLQPEGERVTPNELEAVGFGERSAQEPEVVVNNSGISNTINRNITPTQIDHNFVTPESNLNSDALWVQISQYAEQTQKQFAELEASHTRTKVLTASMDKSVKNLKERHAQLRKSSEETNKR